MLAIDKEEIKREVAHALSLEPEVRRVVVFGSFNRADPPNELDVAVYQDSTADYLSLAMKYSARLRGVSHRIPLDIIPLRRELPARHVMLDEIAKGDVIYER